MHNSQILPIQPITDEQTALAFVLGVLFNQRMRGLDAWKAPARLAERIGGLKVSDILSLSESQLIDLFAVKPAIHPFTTKMAISTFQIARVIEEKYAGDARNIWTPAIGASEFTARLKAFPGIGEHKAEVALFVATVELGIVIMDDGSSHSINSCASLASVFHPLHEPILAN
ncbi:hypothetical protein D3C73_102990 [compost metagenome]